MTLQTGATGICRDWYSILPGYFDNLYNILCALHASDKGMGGRGVVPVSSEYGLRTHVHHADVLTNYLMIRTETIPPYS